MPLELDQLDRAIGLTGSVLWQETENEERLRLAVEAESEWVQYVALAEACPLCAALNGLVFRADSAEAAYLSPPLHPNCMCIWVEVFHTPGDDTLYREGMLDPELLERHGVFVGHRAWDDNPRYAPLQVMSAPSGRDFTFQRFREGDVWVSRIVWHRQPYELPGLFAETEQVAGLPLAGVAASLRAPQTEPGDRWVRPTPSEAP